MENCVGKLAQHQKAACQLLDHAQINAVKAAITLTNRNYRKSHLSSFVYFHKIN